jgi:hypothetical protein
VASSDALTLPLVGRQLEALDLWPLATLLSLCFVAQKELKVPAKTEKHTCLLTKALYTPFIDLNPTRRGSC